MNNYKRILVVAAHPDDEILGCGGAIAKYVDLGAEVYSLILGEGKTSRQANRNSNLLKEEINNLNLETKKANEILGVKEVITRSFPDNRFDSIDLLDIVKEIEKVKFEIQPELILTHHASDLNIDHQLTNQATLTAFRPLPNEILKTIMTFETPSSTEWNSFDSNRIFIPNYFVDISNYIDKKLDALRQYESEMQEYPHPRSIEHIRNLAKTNGAKVGKKFVENFSILRSIF